MLKGKVALITGGTTGIGLATAKRFAAEGARVIVTGRTVDTLRLARELLNGRVQVVESDAGDDAHVAALFADIARDHDRLDVLFLNAGIYRLAPLAEASVADFDLLWRVNVRGAWLALKCALPLLAPGGSVIVNTSVLNRMGMPGTAAYSATKGALRAFVRSAASELAPRGIRVNAISPGPIDTPILAKAGLPAEQIEAFRQNIPTLVPLGRMGSPDEIAAAAFFLASSDASYITGTELVVDGGFVEV